MTGAFTTLDRTIGPGDVALSLSRYVNGVAKRHAEVSRLMLGRRTIEYTILGNLSEDARRTGDWDWILGELDSVHTLGADGVRVAFAEPRYQHEIGAGRNRAELGRPCG